jgi:hypothetical protein
MRRNQSMPSTHRIKASPLQPGGDKRPASSTDQFERNLLNPSVLAANTIAVVLPTETPLDIPVLAGVLAEQARLANDGDLSRGESMLMGQAHTLNALFTALTRRAVAQEYLNQYETYMRLALKAQSQCRATLETLAAIKNPTPVAFVRQANIANGPQQVNNGVRPAAETSRARESENPPNELLEQQYGERLDGGAAQAAVRADSAVAAVGEIHRTADGGR